MNGEHLSTSGARYRDLPDGALVFLEIRLELKLVALRFSTAEAARRMFIAYTEQLAGVRAEMERRRV